MYAEWLLTEPEVKPKLNGSEQWRRIAVWLGSWGGWYTDAAAGSGWESYNIVQVCKGGEPPPFCSLGNTNNSADCREGCQRNPARVCGRLLVRIDAWVLTRSTRSEARSRDGIDETSAETCS
jgi:hypothetical protein